AQAPPLEDGGPPPPSTPARTMRREDPPQAAATAKLQERYALLSQHARDIVLLIDREGVIVEANDAAVAAYGYAREELLGMLSRQFRAEETRDLVAAQLGEAFEKGLLCETVHLRRDGTTFPVEISSRAALVGSERMLLSIVRDLTERAAMQPNRLHAD